MVSVGMTESQAEFGMAAFLAKNDTSEEDKFSTVEALTQYAKKSHQSCRQKVGLLPN
ncbi:hypothetical protein MASR2M36_35780 [Providencia sp.]